MCFILRFLLHSINLVIACYDRVVSLSWMLHNKNLFF